MSEFKRLNSIAIHGVMANYSGPGGIRFLGGAGGGGGFREGSGTYPLCMKPFLVNDLLALRSFDREMGLMNSWPAPHESQRLLVNPVSQYAHFMS